MVSFEWRDGFTRLLRTKARRIAREEALFAGTSSGANVIAAIQVAEQLGPDARVVTLMVDSGVKSELTAYFSCVIVRLFHAHVCVTCNASNEGVRASYH